MQGGNVEGNRVEVFRAEDTPKEEVYKGMYRRRLALGKNLMMNIYEQEPGAVTPEHSHSQELMAILLEGKVEAVFNGVKHLLGPGSGYYIPSNVIHGPFTVVGNEKAVYVDVLSPPRAIEGYAEKK
ncbi:MAG: cupin domain-containing protein [Nitrospinota bacterium]